MFLTLEELEQLTGQKQKAAQLRALRKMNIPHEKNPIGEILVSRSYIERRLSGEATESPANDSEPNFGFLSNGKAQRHTKPRLLAS